LRAQKYPRSVSGVVAIGKLWLREEELGTKGKEAIGIHVKR